MDVFLLMDGAEARGVSGVAGKLVNVYMMGDWKSLISANLIWCFYTLGGQQTRRAIPGFVFCYKGL